MHQNCIDVDLVKGLSEKPYKKIPFKFLYDAEGSKLFEKITNLEEYYPYRAEKDILNRYAGDIVDSIPAGAVIVELGAGDCTKTCVVLNEMVSRRGGDAVQFIAIDVSAEALRQAKASIRDMCAGLPEENVHLIEKEYLNGLSTAQGMVGGAPLCVLWLGSSIGNFTRDESIEFLKVAYSKLNENSMIVLGSDVWKDADMLNRAYDDSQGVTREFICNGMMNVLRCCNHPLRNECATSLWEYEPCVNGELTQVEMWVRAKQGLSLPGVGEPICCGEKLLVEISRKFRDDDLLSIVHAAGLLVSSCWKSPLFRVQLLCGPQAALEHCWRDTDALYSQITDWNAQPIDLRHPFLFYYGHVASFSKSRLSSERDTRMDVMFSRGIDPHVDDPEQCHPHPEVPDAWPSKEKVLEYVENARQSIRKSPLDIPSVCMCLEHERMHQETLCYMLAQLRKEQHHGVHDSHMSYLHAVGAYDGPRHTIHVPESTTVTLGVSKDQYIFRWDNECGSLTDTVKKFHVSSHAVTVGEYMEFLRHEGCQVNCLPATWSTDDGDDQSYIIHMPEASYRADDVIGHPVYVSLEEATAYATWKNGHIMTELEYEAARNTASACTGNLEGGGWEWTSSVFAPFPGFQIDPAYPEYSTDFFDGIHYTLKGSSPYTHSSMVRSSFRNFYQSNYRFVFAKFRVAFQN